MGSTLITLVSDGYFAADPARLPMGIITGVGFIGAGSIIAQGTKGVQGLATAASLWVAAAIGISIGVGWYALSTVVTFVVLLTLYINDVRERKTRA
ncbi:MAG: MgtC/SapB family protein [Nanoarchaeota archaeon]